MRQLLDHNPNKERSLIMNGVERYLRHDSTPLIGIELGFCVLKIGDLVSPMRHFISEWHFFIYPNFISACLPDFQCK
ncbi:MAG: hypothetical protein Q8N05_10775, partial [Bacteroidota bacterium]|nr:hypothetical protein [Bacteroidota bacterium]